MIGTLTFKGLSLNSFVYSWGNSCIRLLLLITTLQFTCGKRKIWYKIKMFPNILTMIVLQKIWIWIGGWKTLNYYFGFFQKNPITLTALRLFVIFKLYFQKIWLLCVIYSGDQTFTILCSWQSIIVLVAPIFSCKHWFSEKLKEVSWNLEVKNCGCQKLIFYQYWDILWSFILVTESTPLKMHPLFTPMGRLSDTEVWSKCETTRPSGSWAISIWLFVCLCGKRPGMSLGWEK